MASNKNTPLALDFQSLSAFRLVFAAYLLGDYWIGVAPYFGDFFTDHGILPLAALASDPEVPVAAAIARVLEAIRLPLIVPYLYPLAVLAFGAGYKTRLSNAVVFVLNSYLFWRNPYILSGAEDLARLVLLWCLFLPMSRYWSVDGALDPQPRDRPYPVLPFLALRLQITSVYVFAGLFKLAGPAWRDGSAVAMVLRDNMYGGTPLGLHLVDHFPGLLRAVTYATIGLQLCLPFLLYSPWYNDVTRGLALAGLAAMHLSFLVLLSIGGFPFTCLSALILLVPDRWWDRLLARRRARLGRVAIFYEPGCGFCHRVALLLREFLLSPTAAVQPADADPDALALLTAHNSWVVRGADDRVYLKWDAVAYVFRQSVLLAPLGWLTDLLALRAPMARVYDFIGRRRRLLGPIARRLLPFRSPAPVGTAAELLCGTLMWFALICNVLSLPWPGKERLGAAVAAKPAGRSQVFEALQIGQAWSLFAPTPTSAQRRYAVTVTTADGVRIALMQRAPHPLFWLADDYRLVFVRHRWMNYFDRLDRLTEPQWAALGTYFCAWAGRASAGSPVSIRDLEIEEFILPVNEIWTTASTPALRRSHTCTQAGS